MGEPQGPRRPRKLALSPGPLPIVPGRRPEPLSKAQAPEMGQSIVIGTTRLHDSAPCPPARAVTVTAHCPLPTGNGKAWTHWVLLRRVLGGAQSLGSDIEPLGPRQHPPPSTTSTSASMASTRAVGALCATTTMTSRCTRPRRSSLTCASTGLPVITFPLMPATICRLMPPRKDVWIKPDQGARIADHDHRSRRADVLAEVRVRQQGFDGLRQDFPDFPGSPSSDQGRARSTTGQSKSPRDVTRTRPSSLWMRDFGHQCFRDRATSLCLHMGDRG